MSSFIVCRDDVQKQKYTVYINNNIYIYNFYIYIYTYIYPKQPGGAFFIAPLVTVPVNWKKSTTQIGTNWTLFYWASKTAPKRPIGSWGQKGSFQKGPVKTMETWQLMKQQNGMDSSLAIFRRHPGWTPITTPRLVIDKSPLVSELSCKVGFGCPVHHQFFLWSSVFRGFSMFTPLRNCLMLQKI